MKQTKKTTQNLDMRNAHKNKKDEFYTQLIDISKEMIYYKNYFKDKVVYCPCDGKSSMFFHLFKGNFKTFELKRLICTSIEGEMYDSLNDEWTTVDNGDMFSDEMREYYNAADVIITNPPFSQFREFITLLIELKKDFIILGNMNSILTKDIFKYIVSGDIFWGVSIHSGDRLFRVPDDYPLESSGYIVKNGIKYIKVKGVRWFTNVKPDNESITPLLDLTHSIETTDYKKFKYIDALFINKTSEIPSDYYGLMGVPLTFFDKYNSEQFEIIDGVNRYLVLDALKINDTAKKNKWHLLTVDDKIKFFRILIKRKN